jgi:DNA-binding Lrp family transcriptional regulator
MSWSNVIRNDFLAILQDGFPLIKKPFEELGSIFGMSEDEAIDLYKCLKEEGIIRQTSAILDTKRLGYDSSLVAFKVKPSHIDTVASFISSHPGVSHNYKRSHDFNLWFTIAVPPDSKLGLTQSVEILADQTGVTGYIVLPTIKMFKIAVKLDTNKSKAKKEKVLNRELKEISLTKLHYKVIELIQEDLTLIPEPFVSMSTSAGISEDELFDTINELILGGYIRRYATILNHRNAGFTSNAMVVWNIQDALALEAGAKAAEFSAVSHCYLRPRAKEWAYNLFTMIHASSISELESVIDSISKELSVDSYLPLHSEHEYKKKRIKYFTNDYYKWEERHGCISF